MNRRLVCYVVPGLIAGLGVAWAATNPGHTAPTRAAVNQAAEPQPDNQTGQNSDRQALDQLTQAIVHAFNGGDAKAVADNWTSQAEYREDSGALLRGRAAIEKAYAALFKDAPGAHLHVQTDSIHFPSANTAIEEGLLTVEHPGAELPTTTAFRAIVVRDGGRWRIAFSQEWGAEEDKLEDLGWLIGNWAARSADREVQLTFSWNQKKNLIENRFTVREGGKVTSSGHQTIGRDPRTGRLVSWSFANDGARGEAVWFRDGNRWVANSVGVLPDGLETHSLNVITRLNDNEILWRSVDRVVGDERLPDTDPIKVIRGQAIRGPQNGKTNKP